MKSNTWQIGNVTITSIVETDASAIIQSVIQGFSHTEIKKHDWLMPDFADAEGNLKAVVQAFVIKTPTKIILVDTCVGNDKERGEIPEWHKLQTSFLDKLAVLGFQPKDIDVVLCTHLHFDHVGWNTMLVDGQWVPTFPNARYLFAETEYNYWLSKPEQEIADDHAGFRDSVKPVVEADLADLVALTHQVTEEVSLVPSSGHTPGHVCVLIQSGGERALVTGDMMHHPCQIAKPEWGTDADTDVDRARETRLEFLDKYANSDLLVIGSHFAFPAAGKVVSDDEGYKLLT